MAKYTTLTGLFSAIANSLRAKTGATGTIVADDFPSVIDSISVGVAGGIIPTGTKSITTNGTHDVKSYASAEVNVPIPSGYITPSGAKSITTNGTHDVTNYASATVNVPTGITPTGTKEITSNGTHDVTNFASANVNVPANVVVRTVTFSSDVTGTGANITLLTNDEFIKQHYSHKGFSVLMYAVTPVASAANVMNMAYHGNVNFGASNVTRTGFFIRGTSSSAVGTGAHSALVNGNGYGNAFRVASDGSLKQYFVAGNIWKAGVYNIVLTCTD